MLIDWVYLSPVFASLLLVLFAIGLILWIAYGPIASVGGKMKPCPIKEVDNTLQRCRLCGGCGQTRASDADRYLETGQLPPLTSEQRRMRDSVLEDRF